MQMGWSIGDSVPGRGWRRAVELNLPTHSLALAAQQMLCTAPLLVAFSALVQRHAGGQAGDALSRYLGLSPPAAADVVDLFHSSGHSSATDTIIGLILALVFGTGVAATQQRFFELLWSQSRTGMRDSWRQLLWVCGLISYLVVVLYAGRLGHGVGRRLHAGRPAGPVTQLLVSLLFFWWSQHLLLAGRVTWWRLLPGAACMALGITILVALSGSVMSHEIVAEVSDYGPIGATFVLSVWLVVLSGLICGSALAGAVINDHHEARAEHRQPS